jgi:hypothetical protein
MPKEQDLTNSRSSTPKAWHDPPSETGWVSGCPNGKRYRDVYRSMVATSPHNGPEARWGEPSDHRERVSFLLFKLSDEELRKVCDTFGLDYNGKSTRTMVQLILMKIL